MNIDLNDIPQQLIDLFLVTLFSLIIGLSQRKLQIEKEDKEVFGTDRTFTFIGLLSYLLYIIDKENLILYITGAIILSTYYLVYYIYKIRETGRFGITSIVVALLTYALPPVLISQPFWFFILLIVIILVFTEIKETLFQFSTKFNKDEFLTLGKFLVIAGVILPIIPDKPIVEFLSITPYKIWLAVVIISSISYISYLIRKFIFKDSGIIITGVLGGMYSSTATTVVLARKMQNDKEQVHKYEAAIVAATAMMYFRILILILIFNKSLFNIVYPYFIALFLISLLVGGGILFYHRKNIKFKDSTNIKSEKNPLEFKVALLFTVLYVAFTFITHFTIEEFGVTGLNVLSILTGVTDIDPFLINLFQGKYEVSSMVIATASLQAIASNNFIKYIYASSLSGGNTWKILAIPFATIIFINIVSIFLI